MDIIKSMFVILKHSNQDIGLIVRSVRKNEITIDYIPEFKNFVIHDCQSKTPDYYFDEREIDTIQNIIFSTLEEEPIDIVFIRNWKFTHDTIIYKLTF
jgi:hypothetical protein